MLANSQETRGLSSTSIRNESFAGHTMWLARCVDGCLAATLIIAPLFMGGRGAIGQLVFVLLPCLAAIAWCARQSLLGESTWRWSGAEWLLSLGALLVIGQLIPWPQFLLTKIVPFTHEMLPLWMHDSASSVQLGQWSTISLTPEYTRGSLTMYLAYGLFFLVLVQRIRTAEDVGRLLQLVATAAGVMAVVGLAQFFGGSDKFLWLYEHPARSAATVVRGAFQNENHLAHFLSLGLGPLIWCLYRARSRRERSHSQAARKHAWTGASHGTLHAALHPFAMAGLVLVGLAGLLTFSRGGVLTMALALVTSIVVMRWKSLIDRRTTAVLSVVAVVNLLAMFLFGMESLSTQLGSVFQATSLTELFDNRLSLWRAMCEGISHFFLTGSGAGSHREVYRVFMEETIDAEFTHGESGYLPLLLETGVFGLALMLAGIAISFRWSLVALRGPADQLSREPSHASSSGEQSPVGLISCACAIIPCLVASTVHSIADFVWYIPACMVLTIAQVACACRLYQLTRAAPANSQARTTGPGLDLIWCRPVPRGAWLALTAVLLLVSWVMIQNRLGPALAATDWDAYFKQSVVRKGKSPLPPSQESESLGTMERHLVNVLRYQPKNAQAHLRLAGIYLQQFELTRRSADNSMDLAQFREAALSSHFPTKEAQDAWLNVALGEGRDLLDKALLHSHQAVALSPLQGLGYVHLARLTFLESPRPELKKAYIDQATKVRPHDGQVLFIRGEEAILADNQEDAIPYLKKAFHQDPELRRQITERLAERIVPADFVAIFAPDTQALGQLFDLYRAKGRVEQAKWVGQQFVTALEKDSLAGPNNEAVGCWQQAQATYSWLGDLEQALRCQQRIVDLNPLDFKQRRMLAHLLSQQHRHAEAVKHLEWCLRRQPDNAELRNELVEAKTQLRQDPAPPPVATNSVVHRRS